MAILSQIKAFFTFKDLRNRVIYTVLLLVIARILAHIPLPGVDTEALRNLILE